MKDIFDNPTMTVNTGSVLDPKPMQIPVSRPSAGSLPMTPPPMADLPENHMLEPEYQDVYRSWKGSPTKATAGAMLTAVKPIIDKGLRSYGRGADNPILRSSAKMLTLHALKQYDPQRAKLQSYLLNHLRGLQRYATQQEEIIHLPERVAMDQQRLAAGEKDLADVLGREPSTAELADHLGMSVKRIKYVRGQGGQLPEGAFQGQGGEVELPGIVSDNHAAWQDFVYHGLAPQDQRVMEYMLGMHGTKKLPLLAVAAKLGLSPSAISQRAKRIQEQLDRREELGLGL